MSSASPAADPGRPTPQPPPDAAALRAAALAYLARYSATEAGLRRVLLRRVERWRRSLAEPDAAADTVAAVRRVVTDVVREFAAAGAIDDAAFAANRGLGLLRAGLSRRGAATRLAAKGIDPARARAALPDDPDAELAAALVLARKRRLGPFAAEPAQDPAAGRRALGVLASAGFPADLARQALAMTVEEAERRIGALRQGTMQG
jgi:regulatory protein